VICASETVACGDGCESTTGFQEFSCSVAPGCAVDGGRGSTSAYPPGNLSVAYMKEMKARLALRRVGVLDLHLATPALATNAERITNIARDVLSCINVTCSEPDSCHTGVTCRNGACPPLPQRMDGAPCDDNDFETDNDRCLRGECIGVDLCANVTCATPPPCQVALGCSRGFCGVNTAENDTICDDGDERTFGDRCQGGMCIGVDPCLAVTCPETECRFAGQCQRPSGLCSLGQPRPPTTACDDQSNRTINDRCSSEGQCRGVDPCIENNVECSPLSQCHVVGDCFLGVCSHPQRADGSACDDGDDRTTSDSCSRGRCRGVDLCVTNGVLCLPTDQCHDVGDCYQGNCTNPILPDQSPCDDQDPKTDNDMCFQGVCMGADLCLGVSCDPSNACHRPGTCRQGICSPRFQPDGTPCSDSNASTDYDTCFQGVCTGIVQPTIGPLKQQVGLQTTTTIAFRGLNVTDVDALLALLQDYFSRSTPAVSPQDVKATSVGSTRARRDIVDSLILNISIATRAFSEAAILAEIRAALANAQLIMLLRLRFPALVRIDVVAAPRTGRHARAHVCVCLFVCLSLSVCLSVCNMMRQNQVGSFNCSLGEEKVFFLAANLSFLVSLKVTVLECLTPVACPLITCQADEVPYTSAYVSVRKCCPTCEKSKSVHITLATLFFCVS
jgi:hypothetical protein